MSILDSTAVVQVMVIVKDINSSSPKKMFKKYILVVKAVVKKSFVVVSKLEGAVAVKVAVAVVLLYILFKVITVVEVYLELILSKEIVV